MTKERELQILQNTAEALGENSYMGPWLRANMAFIESSIRSDMPLIPMAAMHSQVRDAIQNAEARAKEIVTGAQERADHIMNQAWARRKSAVMTAQQQLEKAKQSLNDLI